jgi:hypothetical protein
VKDGYNDVAEGLPCNGDDRYGSPMRRPAVLVVAALIALALAGCAETPVATPSSSSSGPPSFPRVTGTVVSQSEPTRGDWLISVQVADAATAYGEAKRLLTAKGFQVTNDAPASDGGNGQACTTRLCVSFTALAHPGQGPTVDYEVFHSTGVVG